MKKYGNIFTIPESQQMSDEWTSKLFDNQSSGNEALLQENSMSEIMMAYLIKTCQPGQDWFNDRPEIRDWMVRKAFTFFQEVK